MALLAAVLGVWGRGLLRATRAGPTRNEAALDAVDAAASPVDDLEAQALAAGEGGEGPNHDADVDDADVDDADVDDADVANADVDSAADPRAPDAP